MARDDFHVGGWLVQPSLDRLQSAERTLHLRPKTMQVLVVLAEHGGEVVSREHLYCTVWPDVHVSEEGLNHCIAELRAAFGDDARAPKFVETLAKHGYRLVAVVRPADKLPARDELLPAASPPDRPAIWRRWPTSWAILVVGTVVLALAAAVVIRSRGHTPVRGRLTVLLADWKNQTGDPVFDATLNRALGIRIGESPSIRLLSRERVASALQLMRQPPDTPVAGKTAQAVCQRLGGDMVIDGEIASLGKKFVIMLGAVGCGGGRDVAPVRVEANGREDVLRALDRAASSLRERLGYALPPDSKPFRLIEEVTTANLDALRAYSLASDALDRRSVWEAVSLYEHALAIDPDFALAHSRLATTLASIREWKHAGEHRDRALALLKGLTEREQLYVKASHALGHGQFGEAEAHLTTWSQIYPEDRVPLGWLAVGCLNRGDRARALAWAEAATKAGPAPVALASLATAEFSLGQLTAAEAIATRASDRGLLYVLAFVRDDAAAMKQLGDSTAAGSFEELDMRARQAQAAAAVGKIREARQLVGQAEQDGLRMGLRELTAQILATQAIWETELGDELLGTEWAKASLSLDDNPATEALAVLTFARARAIPRAEAMLQRMYGPGTTVDPDVVTGARRKLRAAVDLARGRPDLALDGLAGLGNYEYGSAVNLVALRGDVAELGVFHLRGRAFLSMGQGERAAAEFQRIIDNQTISPLSPYRALAPLNLGRAYGLAGNRTAARQAYERFLERWRGADPEVRLVAQAKREYERLIAGTPVSVAR